MRIKTRDIDAETLVEFTSQLTAAGYWDRFETRAEGLRVLFEHVSGWLEDHADTDWNRPYGDNNYWGAIDAECDLIMAGLPAVSKPD